MKYCTFWNVIVRGMKGNTVLPVRYTVESDRVNYENEQ